jgi:hypothetical protein
MVASGAAQHRAERVRAELTAKMTAEQVAQVEAGDLAQAVATLVARYSQQRRKGFECMDLGVHGRQGGAHAASLGAEAGKGGARLREGVLALSV